MTMFDFGSEQTIWQDINASVSMFGCADCCNILHFSQVSVPRLCNSITLSRVLQLISGHGIYSDAKTGARGKVSWQAVTWPF